MKMPSWIRSTSESLLCSVGFWYKPRSPMWQGRGEEAVCLAPVTFQELAQSRSLDPEERPQAFVADVKPRWISACSTELEQQDREQGVAEDRIAATDYGELAERQWADGGFENAYLGVLKAFETELDFYANGLSIAIPVTAVAVVLLVLGAVANVLNEGAYGRQVAFFQEAFDDQRARYEQSRELVGVLGRIYGDYEIDKPESRRQLITAASAAFTRDIERPGGPPELEGDDKALAEFFDGLKDLTYGDGRGFWFLRRIPLPELEQPELGRSLRTAGTPEELNPEVFSFLAVRFPYGDVRPRDYDRLALMHEWANLEEGLDDGEVLKHLNDIKRKIGGLESVIGTTEADSMREWIDDRCSPPNALALTQPMETDGGYKLVDLIDLQRCAQVCDRLERCRDRGDVSKMAECMAQRAGAILDREAGANKEMMEYLRFRSRLIMADNDPDEVRRLLLKGDPEDPHEIDAKRPEAELDTAGQRCDFGYEELRIEHGLAAELILELDRRQDSYHDYFGAAKLAELEDAFPAPGVLPGERTLWAWLEEPLNAILTAQIIENGQLELGDGDWKDAFGRFRALWELDRERQVLAEAERGRLESLILFTALCDFYSRRLVQAPPNERAAQAKRFANGDHLGFIRHHTVDSGDVDFFQRNFSGKKLDPAAITIDTEKVNTVKRHL